MALWSRPLVVDLFILAGDLAAIPWEAILSLTSLGSRIEKDPLHFRRLLARRTIDTQLRELSPPNREVSFLGDSAWFSISQKAWMASGIPTAQSRGLPMPHRPAFLHIIGEPVTTTRGVSMATGGSRHESNVSQSVSQEVTPSFSLPDLVSADSPLVRGAVGVFVQMEPADSLTRLATDREQAGHLRVFAASLIAQGAERVITVPSLPANLAELVLEVLTPAMVNPERNRLTDAVASARVRILAWPAFLEGGRIHDESYTEALKELAYDVCLFVGLDQTHERVGFL